MLWPSINGHLLGVYFFGGISPSKIGHIAPFLAMIQALSKTRVFLLSKKKQRLLCMGRTSTTNRGNNKKNEKNSLSVSWGLNPARVKASGRGAKF
jgi:hypothetical protein